ncbi:MAG: putative selenoprotein [Candidatus Obscuribacterales bacterium]|nr:putative selenoprotein [Steroidobacteraceae bacterium]
MKQLFLRILRAIRELTTDDAYERYRVHHQARHANEPTLDRHAFYDLQQAEKWNGVKRCC